jgi:hypothetical protein
MEYLIDKAKECQRCKDVKSNKKGLTFAGTTNVYCERCSDNTLEEINEGFIKNFISHIKNEIVWYLNGKEVGRCDLPEGTIGLHRDCLAYSVGIKEYNNVNFLRNGEIRMDGETQMYEGIQLGKFSGEQYSQRIKDGVFR